MLTDPITADQINQAFSHALDTLKCVAEKTREFVMACVIAGSLLKAKRREFPPRAGWLEWLENNCPDISQPTASRLMKISELYYSGANNMPALPARLSSVEELYRALRGPQENPKQENSNTPPPSRVVSALARFWSTVTRRPPSTWDEMERSEFLTDLAEREKIRRENGWHLPTIDVDAETLEPEQDPRPTWVSPPRPHACART